MSILNNTQHALGPFVELIQRELNAAGIGLAGREPETLPAFARWYREAVIALEQLVADRAGQAPTSNRDAELMCRCALSAANLDEAIELMRDFIAALHPRMGTLQLQVDEDVATLTQDPLRPHTDSASGLVHITGLFSFYQLFQWLTDTPIALHRVQVGSIPRENLLPLIRMFDAPVLAGGNQLQLAFDAAALQLAVQRGKHELPAFLQTYPCAMFETTDRDLPRQIRALLGSAIQQGKPAPRAPALAKTLGLTESTLRRRLTAAGTSLRELKAEVSRELAEFFLKETEMSVAEVAARLDFNDDIAFRRAFRRWTGRAPRDNAE